MAALGKVAVASAPHDRRVRERGPSTDNMAQETGGVFMREQDSIGEVISEIR